MERIELAPRVNTRTVATYLGIKDTTVYALCRGMRGWSRIEPLPHFLHPSENKRERYSFDLGAVAAWKARSGYVVSNAGRGKRTVMAPAQACA